MQEADMKAIMQCLGEIKATVEGLKTAINRVVLALIGLIAGQIGVKVLGTPFWLDVATFLAILGAVLLFGALLLGFKVHRASHRLTKTGKSLVVMMAFIILTQVAVYFRDLGYLGVDVIYVIRSFQNVTIIFFAWFIFTERNLFKGAEKPPENCQREE